MRFEIYNIDELDSICKFLKEKIDANVCFLLDGEMGAGKTSLAKKILKSIGVEETVSSPTFVILNQYSNSKLRINHIDAYRLNLNEDPQMYLDEMINSFNIVEWGQNLNIIYIHYFRVIKIKIHLEEDGRRIFLIQEVN